MPCGSCLCGGVTIEVTAELPGIIICHCQHCRRHSGYLFASVEVERSTLRVGGSNLVRWFAATDRARRGFCARCGSSIFWETTQGDLIAVAIGVFDEPTGFAILKHTCTTEALDFALPVGGYGSAMLEKAQLGEGSSTTRATAAWERRNECDQR